MAIDTQRARPGRSGQLDATTLRRHGDGLAREKGGAERLTSEKRLCSELVRGGALKSSAIFLRLARAMIYENPLVVSLHSIGLRVTETPTRSKRYLKLVQTPRSRTSLADFPLT